MYKLFDLWVALVIEYHFIISYLIFIFSCFRDHPEATQQMNDLIIAKVSAALKGHWANPDLVCPIIYPIEEVRQKKD